MGYCGQVPIRNLQFASPYPGLTQVKGFGILILASHTRSNQAIKIGEAAFSRSGRCGRLSKDCIVTEIEGNWERIRQLLTAIYGREAGDTLFPRLLEVVERYAARSTPGARPAHASSELSHKDAILITYGDQFQEEGKAPLRSLAEFCLERLDGLVSGVHILPFYPSSSDDGFAVIDYRAVDPALGSWEDIHRLGDDFKMMFDAVINHVSSQSRWFQGFLSGEPRYQDYFIIVEGKPDLSQVVRPRALPLLTGFDTAAGTRQVWTTFSADQVDLNYHNPQVLLEIINTLLFYVAQGADFIRLDAIAYLWKEIGTACIHLEKTHQVVRLFRAILDCTAPQVYLISETNVPHHDNLSYFGDGKDEAQLVYNFALPPLVLHTFRIGSARALTEWAASLALPPGRATFFNFLASHDGIGINPARGLLSDAEIQALVDQVIANGGLVPYKDNPNGRPTPYELNINYFDALSQPDGREPGHLQVRRFLAAQAILLALVGVPGIYVHSLFGSRNWTTGVALTGRNRSINRQKFDRATLEQELSNPDSLCSQVFAGFSRLLAARASAPAFHPYGQQRPLDCGDGVFGLWRASPDGGSQAICLHNVSGQGQAVSLDHSPLIRPAEFTWKALLAEEPLPVNGKLNLHLKPYQVVWLANEEF
jgi:sucrose phosphorylase